MLRGERETKFAKAWRMKVGMVAIFLLPGFLMGGSLVAVGWFARTDPRHFGGMELGLPVGVAMLVVCALVFFAAFFVLPRRTIASFEFDGARFACRTMQDRPVEYPADAIEMVLPSRGGRGRRTRGWWLTFRRDGKRESLYLERNTSHAAELVAELSKRLDAGRA